MHVPILIIAAAASLFFAPWWVAGAILVGGYGIVELFSKIAHESFMSNPPPKI